MSKRDRKRKHTHENIYHKFSRVDEKIKEVERLERNLQGNGEWNSFFRNLADRHKKNKSIKDLRQDYTKKHYEK